MKVYLSASSAETIRVREAQAMLRQLGIELAYDWLTPIEENLRRGLRDTDLSLEEQRAHVEIDEAAIDACDAFWLLAPERLTKGAWFELGYARKAGKTIVISGPTARECIFNSVASFIVGSDREGIGTLSLLLIARGGS